MKITITVEIFAFAYLFIISAVYFSKKKAKSFENLFYRLLLLNNFFGLIFEFTATFAILYNYKYPLVASSVNRVYMILILFYVLLMSGYVEYSLKDNTGDKNLSIKDLHIFAFNSLFVIVVMCLLPFTYHINNAFYGVEVYVSGFATYFASFFTCVTIIFTFCKLITSKEKNKRDAIIAWVLLFISGMSVIVVRGIHAGVTLLYSIITLSNLVMYFIVQSPDAKKVVELKKIKKNEENINKNKLDFLLNMSHEIRTSLNTIDILGNEVMNSIDDDDEREEAHDILTASDTLLDLVDNILDINKIQNGEYVLNNEDYDLKKEIDTISKMAMVRIENKPINYIMNVDKDIPDILYGDKVKVKQVINNLLTNAFKYTKEGSVILNARCEINDYKANIVVEVKDTGIGIKDTKRLFTKFDRMDMDKTSSIEGTGLGLVITKQLVELMDGKLEVESTYGVGSKFTFTFSQEIGNKIIDSREKNKFNFNLLGKRVLVVDDNILNLKASRKFFSKYNMRIDTCKSGKEAINMVRSNKYDLILMDIVMPDMDGIETLKNIKSFNDSVKIIALTANAINGAREMYEKDGFDGYIEKPIEKYMVDQEFDKLFKE